jgi:serine/threonine protein kinase
MGSYMFFAPEMFMRSDKTVKVRGEQTDIWALGITFYYLIAGVYPCEDATNPMHLRDLILEREINYDLIKNIGARNILKLMLTKDPMKRASLEEIQKDDWVTQNGTKV